MCRAEEKKKRIVTRAHNFYDFAVLECARSFSLAFTLLMCKNKIWICLFDGIVQNESNCMEIPTHTHTHIKKGRARKISFCKSSARELFNVQSNERDRKAVNILYSFGESICWYQSTPPLLCNGIFVITITTTATVTHHYHIICYVSSLLFIYGIFRSYPKCAYVNMCVCWHAFHSWHWCISRSSWLSSRMTNHRNSHSQPDPARTLQNETH